MTRTVSDIEYTKIAEGKTKIIWGNPDSVEVLIESKDDITAGDGTQRDVIQGKAVLATTTTCNVFRLIDTKGVKTHFIDQLDSITFRARRCAMIPIECVGRRIATGSYLKRNPTEEEGQVFIPLVTEFFLKDDSRHDPIMELFKGDGEEAWALWDATQPIDSMTDQGSILVEQFIVGGRKIDSSVAELMTKATVRVYYLLEDAWERQHVKLVDLKLEFGFDTETGQLLVADVIDNDSWRIWPAGIKSQMKDKQVYRDAADRTPEVLGRIRENYAWVAEATKHFSKEDES